MFRYTAPFVRYASLAILSLLLVISAGYATAWLHASKSQPLYDWYAPPRLLTTDLDHSSKFAPGDGLVLDLYVRRNPVNCWAMISPVIKGPVLYQFPSYRNNTLEAVSADVELRVLLELPRHLPPGEYEFYQIVTPTCNGFDKPPYRKDLDLVVTITR